MRGPRGRARGDAAGVTALSLVLVAVSVLYAAALVVGSIQERPATCAEACACREARP